MILLIGLGNPGMKYKKTRHNAGFMVIDRLHGTWNMEHGTWKRKFNADVISCSMFHVPCSMIKPQTYMNRSGETVAKVARFYKINPQNIWVIYDDKDLPLGAIRIREKGSSAGHKGVQSIIDHLNTNQFPRFRIGIGPVPDKVDPRDYVLGKFSKEESAKLKEAIEKLVQAIEYALEYGIEKAMTRFN